MLIKNSFGLSNGVLRFLRKGLPHTELLQPKPQNEALSELTQPQMEPTWTKLRPETEGRSIQTTMCEIRGLPLQALSVVVACYLELLRH